MQHNTKTQRHAEWPSMRTRRLCAHLLAVTLLLAIPLTVRAEPTPAASAAFDAYAAQIEARIAQQHQSAGTFVAPVSLDRLRHGEVIIEPLTPDPGPAIPGAMLHHWRGTAFVPRVTTADFEHLLKDFNAYPQAFAPQVLKETVLAQNGNRFKTRMRVRQHHVLTVVLDTTYDVGFGRLDGQHAFSTSHSTQISEIKSAGTPEERALAPPEEHGFLWRLNTYWSYEERDGGLFMQIESISLTRSIPAGLGWAIRPFVESIPRESLEFTLRAACDALAKSHP